MIRLLCLCVVLAGCTITVTPIAKNTPKHHSTHKRHRVVAAAKPKPTPKVIVDHQWIALYKTLENQHGNYTITDDNNIEVLHDGRFKVPHPVLNHFKDLIAAPIVSPSPSPEEK
jgi:hypothetical protein